MSHRIFTGIGRRKLGKLIEELAGPWLAAGEDRLGEFFDQLAELAARQAGADTMRQGRAGQS